jgi:nicotinate phosphoribosyltransferase
MHSISYSDGLNYERMNKIANYPKQVGYNMGIGTFLTNDLGDEFPAANIVMKAVSFNGIPTVKLSDDPGKHTGPPAQVKRYQRLVSESIVAGSINKLSI